MLALALALAIDFICPMDRDVRSAQAGKCPRCGMKLVANLPEPQEYRVDLKTSPRPLRAGAKARIDFTVRHPKTDAVVREFELMHERLFHLFVISGDLSFFAHEHPGQSSSGAFRFRTTLPKPGLYRVAADFYPKGATPQMVSKTLITAGSGPADVAVAPRLEADLGPQQGSNLKVELVMEPREPLAGKETLLFFRVSPGEGIEQYLGAWGHMLAASDDLLDIVHDHPLYVTLPRIQFNVIFPRERMYRVWVQFQRAGVVNTLAFNVPVRALR